jgi:hypothetical protein
MDAVNPFLAPKPSPKPGILGRLRDQPALAVFALCLVLGLAAAGWRAKVRSDADRAYAAMAALAGGVALEAQLHQAATACEVLAALVAHQGAAPTNFSKIASELSSQRPGLGSLELQPGGVVSDIFPWAGHERVIGFNVLTDPAQRAEAQEAIQSRGATASGPLKLYRGDLGIVVHRPIFVRSRGGRDSFWGFAAASIRLSEAVRRSELDVLSTNGYSYAVFLPASGRERVKSIAVRGTVGLTRAVRQPVRVENLELQIALEPQAGWVNLPKLGFDALAALVGAGLVALMVNLVESRRAVEASLQESNAQISRETTARQQAQDECRRAREDQAAARTECQTAQAALEQAQASIAELAARLESDLQQASQAGAPTDGRAAEAERQVEELNSQLDRAIRQAEEAARVNQARLDEAQQAVEELKARLESASRAEVQGAALRAQLKQAQAKVTDLEERLQAAQRLAQEAGRARDARLAELEATNAQFETRLKQAEVAEGRITELTALLAQAEQELRPQRDLVSPGAAVPTPPVDSALSAPAPVADPDPAAPAASSPDAKPQTSPGRSAHAKERVEPVDPVEEPAANDAAGALPKPTPAAPDEADVPVPKDKAPRAAKPKRSRHDGQMDFFEEKPAPLPARRLPDAPPVNPAELRTAVNQILPLLVDGDPGAKDCLKDNRSTFRSAFVPEAFVEFEQLVKDQKFGTALEQLRKAAKKHGIPA